MHHTFLYTVYGQPSPSLGGDPEIGRGTGKLQRNGMDTGSRQLTWVGDTHYEKGKPQKVLAIEVIHSAVSKHSNVINVKTEWKEDIHDRKESRLS